MDLVITRGPLRIDKAVFSTVRDAFTRTQQMVCLEHLFEAPSGRLLPKIPPGTWICKRGTHTLDGVTWFETFEFLDVPGHTGLLWHKGNWPRDSNGCVCVGMSIGMLEGEDAVIMSAAAFDRLIFIQTALPQFRCTVEDDLWPA